MNFERRAVILILFLIVACSSDEANNCVQTAGKVVILEIQVPSFEKILVNRDIELIIKQGPEIKVTIETGAHLLNDVEIFVIDNQLQLTNNNTCNYIREYGLTKVYVTAPDIFQIRSSTQFDISSQGILNFNTLLLLSEDYGAPGTFTVGDFIMRINCVELSVVINNLSSFYISGYTENLAINFAAGAGRFEGANLMAEKVHIYHRGTNDIIVNPQYSISGELRSTGDVIAIKQPPLVTVEQFYTGQLIFEE